MFQDEIDHACLLRESEIRNKTANRHDRVAPPSHLHNRWQARRRITDRGRRADFVQKRQGDAGSPTRGRTRSTHLETKYPAPLEPAVAEHAAVINHILNAVSKQRQYFR